MWVATWSLTNVLGVLTPLFSSFLPPVICNTCSCLDPSRYTVTPFRPSSWDKRYARFTSSTVTSPGILMVFAIALEITFAILLVPSGDLSNVYQLQLQRYSA